MNKQSIIASVKAEKSYLQAHFLVKEIALFGSYASGDETADSDVDILVKMETKTLRNYSGIIDYLQEKLKSKSDYISERFLRVISKDIIYV
jgi:predicted nucleotidyltransferase